MDERWPQLPAAVGSDPLGYVFLGLLLIAVGGIALLLDMGILGPWDAAGVFLALVALILWLDAAIRYRSPWSRRKAISYAVIASVLMALGISLLLRLSCLWCLPLMALGLCSTLYGLGRLLSRRRH